MFPLRITKFISASNLPRFGNFQLSLARGRKYSSIYFVNSNFARYRTLLKMNLSCSRNQRNIKYIKAKGNDEREVLYGF